MRSAASAGGRKPPKGASYDKADGPEQPQETRCKGEAALGHDGEALPQSLARFWRPLGRRTNSPYRDNAGPSSRPFHAMPCQLGHSYWLLMMLVVSKFCSFFLALVGLKGAVGSLAARQRHWSSLRAYQRQLVWFLGRGDTSPSVYFEGRAAAREHTAKYVILATYLIPGPSPSVSPRHWAKTLRPWRAASVHSATTNVRSVVGGG